MSIVKILNQIYYDPKNPASFGGAQILYLAARKLKKTITRHHVKQFLQSQPTYTLHFPVKKRFKRRKILARYIDHIWEADLIDVQAISKENRGFRYILTVIDILSRYAFAIPIKDKTADSVIFAFKKIFSKSERRPKKLHTDKGREFLSHKFLNFLKQNDIIQYSTSSEIKASLVERFNRTLKNRLYKYFTAKKTLHYIRVLPSLLQGYNNKIHRSHGVAPSTVNKKNQKKIWSILYQDYLHERAKPAKLKIGDFVRLSKYRNQFSKSYLQGWTKEIFVVEDVFGTNPVTYSIRDSHGDILEGRFYEAELIKFLLK